MDINFKLTFNIDPALAEALELNEDTLFETFYDDGKIIIQTIDADDFIEEDLEDDDCEFDECKDCPCFCQNCGKCTYDD